MQRGELMSNVGTGTVAGPAIQVGTLDVVTGNYIPDPSDPFFSTAGIDVSELLGNGSGGFAAAGGSPLPVNSTPSGATNVDVALADLNGDGRLDMAVSDLTNSEVHVFLGDGHGGFSAGPTVATGPSPYVVTLGDLNGDGRLDIVTANPGDDTLSVSLAEGLGGYAAPISIPAGVQPTSLALGDVNGDGTLD